MQECCNYANDQQQQNKFQKQTCNKENDLKQENHNNHCDNQPKEVFQHFQNTFLNLPYVEHVQLTIVIDVA